MADECPPEPRQLKQSLSLSRQNETLGSESIQLSNQASKQAQSLRLALMYKKEAIENRKKRGIQTDISLKDLGEVRETASLDLSPAASDKQVFAVEIHENEFDCINEEQSS